MASVASENNEQIALNIMPMLDIFSILILFLLMSFSTDPISHDLDKAVELPESTTIVSLDEIPAVRMTKEVIMVNDKEVSKILKNRKIAEDDKNQGAIYNLYLELKKLAEANKNVLQEASKKPLSLTMEIDKDHYFELIKQVMLSAQQAEFVKFKLMVSKEL